MKALLLSSLLASTVLLSGCVISIDDDNEDGFHLSNSSYWQKREANNRQYIAELSVGASKTAIIEKFGAADFNELTSSNGDAVQVLYYRTHRVAEDGVTTKNECTPLVFVNDELVGWGEISVSKYL